MKTNTRTDSILKAAIAVFGKYGFKKTSVDDIAQAAQISKQGLYIHFPSKHDIFVAALIQYLDEGLLLVQAALDKPNATLHDKIFSALDQWFGRHRSTFSSNAFDVIETGNSHFKTEIDKYKSSFKAKLTRALSESIELEKRDKTCSPSEIAEALFLCGLSWKDDSLTASDFKNKMSLCVRVCCRVEKRRKV